jgi:uncharacterized protein (DUF2267 family)
MTYPRILQKNLHRVQEWLYDIEDYGGWSDTTTSLTCLRIVLHHLRDHLPPANLAHLSAQLPLFIRGLLFENWNPEHKPVKERKRDEFLDAIAQDLENHPEISADQAVQAVFCTLQRKISEGEIEKLKSVLPNPISALFDDGCLPAFSTFLNTA